MQNIFQTLESLRRPKLLIQAARIGAAEYQGKARLAKLIDAGDLMRGGSALSRLLDMEQDVNDLRKQHATSYSVAYHVELLTAVMGEARLLRASHKSQVSGECVRH